MEEVLAPDTNARSPSPGLIAVSPKRDASIEERLLEGRGWSLLRLAFDSASLVLAAIWASVAGPDSLDGSSLVWLFPPLVVVTMASRRLYDSRAGASILDVAVKIIASTALATVILVAADAFVSPQEASAAPLLARAWAFGTLLLLANRVLVQWGRHRALARGLLASPTLIVGAGVIGAHVERRLRDQPELGLQPVGYLDADPAPAEMVPDRRVPIVGSPEDMETAIRETNARHVVFSFLNAPDRDIIPLVERATDAGCEVSIVPRLFESINVHFALEHLGGLPLFAIRSIDPKGWQFAVKHLFDRLTATVLLALLLPLLAILALAIRINSPGPILFRQVRVGRDGHEFEMLKFRSMRVVTGDDGAPAEVQAQGFYPRAVGSDVAPGGVEGVDRRTAVGAFLRSTSLDELPQLINVLKGDMSLVGPRPERPEFVEAFGSRLDRYDRRHRVRSGITGWAQVNGLRGKTSLRDRVEWDNFYIENWSLGLDLKILLLTVRSLFQRAE